MAKDKHKYSAEQAYALLFSNKYNLVQSLNDLPLYSSNVVDFNDHEKSIYSQLFGQHRKDFSSYLSYLPNRTCKELIMYYYLNKFQLTSRNPKKKKSHTRSRDDTESQVDYKKLALPKIRDRESICCAMCFKSDTELFKTSSDASYCHQCFEKRRNGSVEELYGEEYGSSKSDHLEDLEEFAENIADLNEAGINNLNMNTQELNRKIRELEVEVIRKKEQLNEDFGTATSGTKSRGS